MDCSPQGSSVHGIFHARNWNGLPFPPPGDLPNPEIEPTSPVFPALAGKFFITEPPRKPQLPKESESKVAQSCPTLCDPMDCSLSGSSVHGDFPVKSAGVDCHFLLQGIFPTQESNRLSSIAGRRFTV